MFTLQRASAGSGKTYTLAKKYIRLLISETGSNGKSRLLTEAEIHNRLRSILAITFTNKATNEMKQRVIDKLAALAKAAHPEELTEEELDDIDYLK